MMELLLPSSIERDSYRKIISEIEKMWKELNKHRYEINIISGNRSFLAKLDVIYYKLFPVTTQKKSTFESLWKRLCRLYIKYINVHACCSYILQSSRLSSIRCWEYPWVILNSKVKEGMKLLDVGSGVSLFPIYLAREGMKVDAIDIDEFNVTKICPYLAKIHNVKINYFVQNVCKLNYKDETFDRIFCISVLEHIEEKIVNGQSVNFHNRNLDVIAISELLRVLKPNGLLLITVDWNENPHDKRSYTLDDIEKRLLRPYNHFLLDSTKPVVNWAEYRLNIMRLWKIKHPYIDGMDRSSVGIILSKKSKKQ